MKASLISIIILIVATAVLASSASLQMAKTPVMIVEALILALSLGIILHGYRRASSDERELWHRGRSYYWAALAGSAILIVGVIWQVFHQNLDLWLVYAVAAMAMVRVLSYWYLDRNN